MTKRKLRRMRRSAPAAAAGKEEPFHPAYGLMQGLVRIMPGTDLTTPADPERADRLDAEYGLEKRNEKLGSAPAARLLGLTIRPRRRDGR